MPAPTPQLLPELVSMTPDRFRECLDELGISQRDVARLIGSATRLPGEWANGVHSIPPAIGDWLEACVQIKAKQIPLPAPPTDWRRRYSLARIKRQRRLSK